MSRRNLLFVPLLHWMTASLVFALCTLPPGSLRAQTIPTATATPPERVTVTAVATDTLTPTLPPATATWTATVHTATVHPSAIPSPTAVPSATPTIDLTPTADPRDWAEPNNEPGQAAPINLNESLTGLNLDPVGDKDYYQLYLKVGQLVRVSTYPEAATDTRMTVYSPAGELLGQNDDRSQTDLGSTVAWLSQVEGWYLILVESSIPFGGVYRLLASLDMPTSTPTPVNTPTPGPTSTAVPTTTPLPTTTPYTQADTGEPNNRPEDAFEILPNTEYPMTLGPIGTDTHDFFILLGKAGVTYQCQASQPQGVDPALRVYVGEIGSGILVAENDDVSAADIGSQVRFTPQTNATFYLVAEARAGYGRYTLRCTSGASTSGSAGSSNPPQPTPTPTPDPDAFRIQVFLDWNEDEMLTSGEGVAEVLVLITSLAEGQTITRYTKGGEVLLSAEELPGFTQVVVTIPYLHHSQVVNLEQVHQIALPLDAPTLPVVLP